MGVSATQWNKPGSQIHLTETNVWAIKGSTDLHFKSALSSDGIFGPEQYKKYHRPHQRCVHTYTSRSASVSWLSPVWYVGTTCWCPGRSRAWEAAPCRFPGRWRRRLKEEQEAGQCFLWLLFIISLIYLKCKKKRREKLQVRGQYLYLGSWRARWAQSPSGRPAGSPSWRCAESVQWFQRWCPGNRKKCKRNFVLWRSCLHLISTTSRGACESHQPEVDFEAQSDALSFTFPPCVGSEAAISATHHGQTPLHVQGCQDEHAWHWNTEEKTSWLKSQAWLTTSRFSAASGASSVLRNDECPLHQLLLR